jgi:hypothetical protein
MRIMDVQTCWNEPLTSLLLVAVKQNDKLEGHIAVKVTVRYPLYHALPQP